MPEGCLQHRQDQSPPPMTDKEVALAFHRKNPYGMSYEERQLARVIVEEEARETPE